MTTLFLILLSVIGLIVSVRAWFKNKINYWSKKGISTSENLSLFGNYKDYITVKRTECEITDEEYWKHENVPYCGLYFFWKPQVLIRDVDMVKKIMIKDFEYFTDRTGISSTFNGYDTVLQTVFFMKGQIWKNRRTAMTSVFTPIKLKSMVGQINQICSEHLENLVADQKDINIENLSNIISIEVIMAILFGLDVRGEIDPFIKASREFSHPEVKSVLKQLLSSLNPDIHKALNLNTITKSLYEFYSNLLEQNIKHRTNNEENLLFRFFSKVRNGTEKGIDGMTTNEMIGHCFGFFVAGQDTTASTIALTLYELAKNSALQSKIRKEVEEVLNGCMEVNYESVKKMKSVENAIKETLRMYPVLGLLKRVCTKDYQLDEKLTIPKDMVVIIPVRAFHYDPTFFKDPYLYNPDRFLEEPPWAYMPFGKGQRSCLGIRLAEIQTKIIVASFLMNFELTSSPKMIDSLSWDPRTLVITNRPVGGLWLRLIRRK